MKVSFTLCSTFLAIAAVAFGAPEAVPFEFELPSDLIELSLFDCRVEIVIETGAQPLIRAFSAQESAGDPARFDVAQAAGAVRITRLESAEGTPVTTAIVELVMDPNQPLRVVGRGLTVSVRGEGKPPEQDDSHGLDATADPAAASPTAHNYEVSDSELNLFRAPPSQFIVINTAIHTEGGFGAISADLEWSGMTIRAHEGPIQLTSRDSETVVDRLAGDATFDLIGGSLELIDGQGTISGECQTGTAIVDHWEGSAAINGSDATVSFRDGSMDRITFTGVDSDLTVDGVSGAVKADLTGGDVTAQATRGELNITAVEGARITAEDLSGPMVLTLRNGADAEVRNASGGLNAKVHGSRLLTSIASKLDLDATDSNLTLEGIEHITRLTINRSDAEVDLRQTRDRKLKLKVPADTFVRMTLYSPCKVRVSQTGDTGNGFSVTGCELQIGTSGRWRGGMLRAPDGRLPFMLIAEVADTGDLRVQGGP